MKSHSWLLEALLHDCGVQCSVPPREIVRDLRTILDRVETEGLSFLTITLPAFGSAILRALADGYLPSAGVPGFRSSCGTPAFMQGFLRMIFCSNGRLLDEPSVTAIACIHQVTLTFKKVEAQCSDTRVRDAMRKFIEVDRSLPDIPEVGRVPTNAGAKAPALRDLSALFHALFHDALRPIDRKIWTGERLGAKHGPGATAEKVVHNDKYRWTQWTDRLNQVFPSDLYLHAMENSTLDDPACLQIPLETIAPGHETPVRVVHVPKTMKAPRVIAVEPVSMQYMQQGLLSSITEGIRRSFMKNVCVFDDQSINAQRALEGSRHGKFATLDLSDASDRVGFRLVEALVRPRFPQLMDALDATRSRRARVPARDPSWGASQYDGCPVGGVLGDAQTLARGPVGLDFGPSPADPCAHSLLQAPKQWEPLERGTVCNEHVLHSRGGRASRCDGVLGRRLSPRNRRQRTPASETVLELRKFASMGSAVCFPVEAMVFTTIVFAGLLDRRNLPFTKRNVRKFLNVVSVFGDDIIVPTDDAPIVADYLEAYGLKVNSRKSFSTGNFRESCGTDAFKGADITPAYLKTLDWGDNGSLEWLARWVEFSNALYMKGFWETSRIVRKRIAHLGYRIPMVSATSPAIGYHNVRGTYEWFSWCSKTHAPRVRAYHYRVKKVDSPLDGVAALRKYLTSATVRSRVSFDEPCTFQDVEHLRRAQLRSASVSTKKRWLAPF